MSARHEDLVRRLGATVRAAELYLHVLGQTTELDRRYAFEQERDRMHALSGDADAQAIATNIETYLTATQADEGGAS